MGEPGRVRLREEDLERLQWGTGLICSWDFPKLVDLGKRGSNGDLETSILGAPHLEDDAKYRKSVR